jgi:hypothetical protein
MLFSQCSKSLGARLMCGSSLCFPEIFREIRFMTAAAAFSKPDSCNYMLPSQEDVLFTSAL